MTRLKLSAQILTVRKITQRSKFVIKKRVCMFSLEIPFTPFCYFFSCFDFFNKQLKNKMSSLSQCIYYWYHVLLSSYFHMFKEHEIKNN